MLAGVRLGGLGDLSPGLPVGQSALALDQRACHLPGAQTSALTQGLRAGPVGGRARPALGHHHVDPAPAEAPRGACSAHAGVRADSSCAVPLCHSPGGPPTSVPGCCRLSRGLFRHPSSLPLLTMGFCRGRSLQLSRWSRGPLRCLRASQLPGSAALRAPNPPPPAIAEGQGRASFLREPGTLILPVPDVGVAGGRMSLTRVTQDIGPQTAPGRP